MAQRFWEYLYSRLIRLFLLRLEAAPGEGGFGNQFDNMILTVKIGTKKLEESGLAKQSVVELRGNKTHNSRPFENLNAVPNSELYLTIPADYHLRPSRQ